MENILFDLIDNYLDLFNNEISRIKGVIISHYDGFNYTEMIMNNTSTISYFNGDEVITKIECDKNGDVILFEKKKTFTNGRTEEIVVTKNEIRIKKNN